MLRRANMLGGAIILPIVLSCSPMHTSSIYSGHSYSAHPSWAFVPFPLLAPLLALRSPLPPVRAMCLHDRARMDPLAFMTGQQHRSGRGEVSSSAGKGCRGGALELNARVREEESTLATRGYKIWYSVISPETRMPQRVYKQGTCTPLPIVVLHGGPGVPSDYLLPLKSLAAREQRKMFFYDQLGCGRSEGPKDESFYSVRQAAEDAMTMLNHFADFHGLMDLGGFHLYGHSWGGCLAAEIVMNQLAEDLRIQQGLASVVLSNAPTSPQDAMNAARKLISIYTDEMWGRKPDEIGMPKDWPRDDEMIQHWKLQKANEKFERTNNLRLNTVPKALERAYQRMGIQFYGEKAVRDWRADEQQLLARWPPLLPALVMRGEHDFVSTDAVAAYVEGIPLAQYAELAGQSHMAHLEDEERYCGVLDGWLLSVEATREANRRRALR